MITNRKLLAVLVVVVVWFALSLVCHASVTVSGSATVQNVGTCSEAYTFYLVNGAGQVDATSGSEFAVNPNSTINRSWSFTEPTGGYTMYLVQGNFPLANGAAVASINNAMLPTGSTVYITAGVAGVCATNWCIATNVFYTFTVQNNSAAYQNYQVVSPAGSCSPVIPTAGASYASVPPGGSQTITFVVTYNCGQTPISPSAMGIVLAGQGNANTGTTIDPQTGLGPVYQWLTPGSPCTWNPTGGTVGGSGGPGGGGGSGGGGGGTGGGGPAGTGFTPYTPTTFSTNDMTLTNGIIWSTNGTPLDGGAMQEGFSALYDATVQGFSGVQNLQVQQQNTLANGFGGVTNFLAAGNAIASVETNLTGLSANFLNIGNAQRMAVSNNTWWAQNYAQLGVVFGASISNSMFVGTNVQRAQMLNESNLLVAATNIYGQQGVSNYVYYQGTSNLLAGISNAVATGNGTLTNALYWLGQYLSNTIAGGTNGSDTFGITNNATGNMLALSNGLSPLVDSNGVGSGYLLRPGDIGATGTNYGAAQAAVGTQIGDAEGTVFSGAESDGAGMAGAVPAGAAPVFSIPFVGGALLNLDPDVFLPGAMDFVYYLTEVVILIGFYLSSGKLYMWFMSDLSRLKTGSVPNLNAEVFGVGGNLLGLAVHPIVCAAIITAWVTVLTVTVGSWPSFGTVTDALGHAGSAGGAAGSAAWYLLNRTVPLPLLFSLVGTRIILQFSMAHLILTVAAIMRFFVGSG